MASFNRVILMGNLTRDPQLSYLPSNTAVCEFGLAMNRKWRGQDGNLQDETCFVDCSVYGRQADTFNQYMTKGRPVMVEGRLRLRQWETPEGQRRSKLSVVVDSFQFLGSAQGGTSSNAGPRGGSNQAQQAQQGQQAPSGPPPEDVPPPTGDDDVPF